MVVHSKPLGSTSLQASASLVDSESQAKCITFTAVLLVLASALVAIWSTQQVRSELCSLDIAVRVSEV